MVLKNVIRTISFIYTENHSAIHQVPAGALECTVPLSAILIPVIAHQAEALVLRTWPLHEADQIVSLFTRDQGKLKGVAKSSAKSRKRFGGALEPMTYVLASYVEKPRQELVRLDSCEILASPLSAPVDYARAAALAFFAEVLEETLPDHDPQDPSFASLWPSSITPAPAKSGFR